MVSNTVFRRSRGNTSAVSASAVPLGCVDEEVWNAARRSASSLKFAMLVRLWPRPPSPRNSLIVIGRTHGSRLYPALGLSPGSRRDLVDDPFLTLGVDSRSRMRGADLLHRAPRAAIVLSDEKDDAVDETERVLEHESLQFAVVPAAPVGASQKRPADLDFAPALVVAMEPGGSDDPPIAYVDRDERATGPQCFIEVDAEAPLRVAVAFGVLLPDGRVRRDRIEGIEIIQTKRPELEEIAFEDRLNVEGHRKLGFANREAAIPRMIG
jgi:hypothetical protein